MNPLSTALFARAREGATGALDWTDGRRRRVYYFDRGQVVLVQSNLRSETPEKIAESTPGLTPAEALAAAGRARVAGGLREAGGEVRWVEGSAAGKAEPVDLSDVLFEVGTRRPAITAYLKLAGAAGSWLHRQAMPAELQNYLEDLDGTRTFDEVLSFAPCEPAIVDRWVRIGFTLGAIVDVGIEASPYEVRSVNKKREWAGGSSVDDIASLISEGLGQKSAPTGAAVDPVEKRFGPALTRIRQAPDHFAVLGVSWQDPPEGMRRSYFTLARELHPDRFAGDPPAVQEVAAELFDKVRAAWETLGDDVRRDAYIRKVIKGEKTEDELAMEKVRAILDAEGDFKKGMAEFYAGRLAQAHELFTRAADTVADDAEMAAYAGYTTFKMNHPKDPAKAEAGAARIREAIERNERLDGAWVLLGLVQVARGDQAGARESFVKALRIKPSNPDAVRELKRLEREKAAPAAGDGLFSKLFGKK